VQEILIGLHAKRHTWDETRPSCPGFTPFTRYMFIDAGPRLRREASWRVEITSGAVRRAGLLSEPNVSLRAIRLPYGSWFSGVRRRRDQILHHDRSHRE
jgi:hypothetical protein